MITIRKAGEFNGEPFYRIKRKGDDEPVAIIGFSQQSGEYKFYFLEHGKRKGFMLNFEELDQVHSRMRQLI